MSTDVTPQGQAGEFPAAGARQSPQALIAESIKYRRRAQEAERRAEALEAEIAELRSARQADAGDLEQELAAARTEADTLRTHLETLKRDRRLERELRNAGCTDPETGLALARERLAAGDPPEDLAALARALVEEKPHLRAGGAGGPAPLPPPTAAPRTHAADAARRDVERLADRARTTGHTGDVMAYLRARRTGRA